MPFSWSSEANNAFAKLKALFISAPVLTQPDHRKQFIVEVDTSDIGVGAVLFQYARPDSHLQQSAFFSCPLFPSERNYDVLAIKLALEE